MIGLSLVQWNLAGLEIHDRRLFTAMQKSYRSTIPLLVDDCLEKFYRYPFPAKIMRPI